MDAIFFFLRIGFCTKPVVAFMGLQPQIFQKKDPNIDWICLKICFA